MSKKFHHIGIATSDIEKSALFVNQNFNIKEESDKIFDEKQNVFLKIFYLQDGSAIELVEGDKINSFIQKKQFLYHTCWETENINQEIQLLLTWKGNFLIQEPTEAILFNNRKVAFLYTPLGILELLEISVY